MGGIVPSFLRRPESAIFLKLDKAGLFSEQAHMVEIWHIPITGSLTQEGLQDVLARPHRVLVLDRHLQAIIQLYLTAEETEAIIHYYLVDSKRLYHYLSNTKQPFYIFTDLSIDFDPTPWFPGNEDNFARIYDAEWQQGQAYTKSQLDTYIDLRKNN